MPYCLATLLILMALYFYFIRCNAFSCDTKDLHLHLPLFIGCDNIWDCCTNENPCGLNMGDCDLNDHCMNDLVCGIANCGAGFPVNTDCCENSGTYLHFFIIFFCSKFQNGVSFFNLGLTFEKRKDLIFGIIQALFIN